MSRTGWQDVTADSSRELLVFSSLTRRFDAMTNLGREQARDAHLLSRELGASPAVAHSVDQASNPLAFIYSSVRTCEIAQT